MMSDRVVLFTFMEEMKTAAWSMCQSPGHR